jgi:hypothetical protein
MIRPFFVVIRHCERSEAIQLYGSKAGLLRRFAPRNDDYAAFSASFFGGKRP